jgi:hypothetical protein
MSDVATKQSGDLAIPEKAASAFVAELFRTHAFDDPTLKFTNPPLTPEQKDELQEAFHAAKHEATSLEAMLEGTDSGLVASKDYTNRPFKIADVAWRASELDGEGLPLFAILTVVTAQGEEKKVSTGAKSVCEAIALGDAKGWFGTGEDKNWLKFVAIALYDEDGKLRKNSALELHIADDIAPF